jgi:hypothetical protein
MAPATIAHPHNANKYVMAFWHLGILWRLSSIIIFGAIAEAPDNESQTALASCSRRSDTNG